MLCLYVYKNSTKLLLCNFACKLVLKVVYGLIRLRKRYYVGVRMDKTMAKRVFATVPDTLAEDLEDWAEQEGRSLSSLVAYLLETRMKEAKSKGEFTPSKRNSAT